MVLRNSARRRVIGLCLATVSLLGLVGCGGTPKPEGGDPAPSDPETKLVASKGQQVKPNTILYTRDGKTFGTVLAIEENHHFEDGRIGTGWQVKHPELPEPRWDNGDVVGPGTYVKVPK